MYSSKASRFEVDGNARKVPNFSDNLKYARKSSEVSYRWSRVTGRFFVSASRSLVVSFRMTCDFCRIYFGVVLIELQSSAFMQRRRFTLPGFCGQNSFIFLLRQNKFPVTLSIKKYLWKLYFNSWSFVYVNDSRNCALSLTIMQRSNYSESWANLFKRPAAVVFSFRSWRFNFFRKQQKSAWRDCSGGSFCRISPLLLRAFVS